MTPQELLLKANRTLESARLLLESGDVDGACTLDRAAIERTIQRFRDIGERDWHAATSE